jgi:CheY-like chemotaxis protein
MQVESLVQPSSPTGVSILVVDDNTDTAESLALLLRIHGYEVRVVNDGPSALAEAAARLPCVVLLDINLPGMDGFETARLLRAQAGNSLRLVALTGCSREEDRRRGQEAGFDAYLIKPAEIEDLERALQQRPE